MTTRKAALGWIRIALGNPGAEFRDGQWEAINQLVSQRGRVHHLLGLDFDGTSHAAARGIAPLRGKRYEN